MPFYAVPCLGDIVIAKIDKISKIRGAECFIISVNGELLGEVYRGLVRSVDMQPVGIEIGQVNDCFNCGDIIRAKVISIGDAKHGYLLSTVSDDLGVIRGTKGLDVPVSFRLITNKDRTVLQNRKVAHITSN